MIEVHDIHRAGARNPTFLFVPGFFTQPLISGRPMDLSWDKQVLEFCRTKCFNGKIIRWRAGNISDILLGGANTNAMITAWQNALSQADLVAAELADLIDSTETPVHLSGHSLGGRISLFAAQKTKRHTLQTLTALAPACEINILDYYGVANRVDSPPNICFSRRDKTLSILFTCGQSSEIIMSALSEVTSSPSKALGTLSKLVERRACSPAIGLVGIPRQFAHAFNLVNTNYRHLEYCSKLSQTLNRLSI